MTLSDANLIRPVVVAKVLGQLRSTPAGLTRTEIRALVGGRVTKASIELTLALLARHRLAEMTLETGTGGRPAERWSATGGPE